MVPNRGPITSGVTLALILVATVVVGTRFFTRIYLVKSIKQDDWWILAAWLCAVGFSASICFGVSDGLGMHQQDIIPQERDGFRRAQYAYSILYNPCLMLTKTSIVVFYLSVMSKDVDRIFRWCNWLTLALVNVAGTALTLLTIFQCRPVSAGYSWQGTADAKCTDIVTLYLSSAPVNIITDLALLLLPMPILTGLRLPKKQKIILVGTFSAGILVAVIDVVRIAYLQNAAQDRLRLQSTGQGGTGKIVETSDFSWYASLSFMWSAVEVNLGIVCACVPSLKPLFLKFAPSLIKDAGDDISPTSSMASQEKRSNAPLLPSNIDANVITNPAAFRRPAVSEYDGDDDGDYMGFLNMLAGSERDASHPNIGQGATNASQFSHLSRIVTAESKASEFGFVKMDKNRNMLQLSNRQSAWPIAVVTVMFFLWGFAYGLLDILNAQFQEIANLSSGQALALHGAYFGGYFFGPLTLGRFFMRNYGFKSTMICGLCVYGAGTLVFWPSAVLTSYPAFIVSNAIIGFGLSCLEISSNPYIALCGPLEYAEARLNFAQAFQAVGSVCSPLLAKRVLFKNVLNAPSLVDVQWAYLAFSFFDFALAIIFWYIPLPEATEEQLEEQASKRSAVYRTRFGGVRIVWYTLALGVFAQWCYVGTQEGHGANTEGIAHLFLPTTSSVDAFDFDRLGHTTFAIGRFIGAFLNYLIKPRLILMTCFVGCIILSAIQMSASGTSALVVNILIYFFEGSIFPIVYAIGMRGMGDQTFNGAAFMTSAIASGAIVPAIVWAVSNSHGVKYSYSVVLAFFAFGAVFPVYLNSVPAARRQVDPIHESRERKRRTRAVLGIGSTFSDGSQSVDTGASHLPTAEHVERPNEQDPDSPRSPRNTRFHDDSVSFPSPVRTRSIRSYVGSVVSWQDGYSSSESGDSQNRIDWTSQRVHYQREIMACGASGADGEILGPVQIQERRDWTEEDDVRLDYHEALKGL